MLFTSPHNTHIFLLYIIYTLTICVFTNSQACAPNWAQLQYFQIIRRPNCKFLRWPIYGGPLVTCFAVTFYSLCDFYKISRGFLETFLWRLFLDCLFFLFFLAATFYKNSELNQNIKFLRRSRVLKYPIRLLCWYHWLSLI